MPIVVENLSHTYSPGTPFEAQAVAEVSLCVPDGAWMAVIGHTGSGKTTLVQHFNGLLKPTAGRVLIDGHDLWAGDADRRRMRQKVGLVFQYPEYQLFEETVAKDIAFGPKNLGLSEQECRERAQEAAQRVGLSWDDVAEKSPFELSGGQKRRAAIAGVLAMRPDYLVLDEPSAGLDPRGREEIMALLAQVHAQGVTLVMVSHAMDDIAGVVDNVAVMENGRLIMQAPPRRLFAEAQRLTKMGLGIPEVTELCLLLRQRGWDIPLCLTVEEAAREIAARVGQKPA